ncbi:MAG: porin family protein [Bacteroidota bacterium]
MKKAILLIGFFTVSVLGFAQDKKVNLGIRTAINLGSNNAEGENYSKNGSGMRLSGGLIVDFNLSDNYAISTGVLYTIKRAGFKRTLPNNTTQSSVYNLQVLQLPISLKLFTSEVATDTRLYFQVGSTVDIKLAEVPLDKATNFLFNETKGSVYKPVGVGLLLGAGVEMRLSDANSVFFGLNYNRGLINATGSAAFNVDGSKFYDQVSSRLNLFGLEAGLKF